MTQFIDSPVKREAQELLFSGIKANTCLGLAGPNPDPYLEILKRHANNVILCDFNPSRDYVRKNSLIGEFDLNASKIDFIDADFCTTIISNEACLRYLISSCKRLNHPVTLCVNLSIRKDTLETIFSKIFNLFNLNLTTSQLKIYKSVNYPGSRKFLYEYTEIQGLKFVEYRDSGSNMLSFRYTIQPDNYKPSEKKSLQNVINFIAPIVKSNPEKVYVTSTSLVKQLKDKYNFETNIFALGMALKRLAFEQNTEFKWRVIIN